MTLETLTPREASIFACLTDTVVAPRPLLPPVAETDTAAFFDRWMGRSPRLNRTGFRALLYVVEVAPLDAYGVTGSVDPGRCHVILVLPARPDREPTAAVAHTDNDHRRSIGFEAPHTRLR